MRRIIGVSVASLAAGLTLGAPTAGAKGLVQQSFTPAERTETGIIGPTYSQQVDGGGGLQTLSVTGPIVDLTEQKEGAVIIVLPAVDHTGTGGGPH